MSVNENYTLYILDSRTLLSKTRDKSFLWIIPYKHVSVCNIFYHGFSFTRLFGGNIMGPFDFVQLPIPSIF